MIAPKPMTIHSMEEVLDEVRVHWVVELWKTVADMHTGSTHFESPVSSVIEPVARSWWACSAL